MGQLVPFPPPSPTSGICFTEVPTLDTGMVSADGVRGGSRDIARNSNLKAGWMRISRRKLDMATAAHSDGNRC